MSYNGGLIGLFTSRRAALERTIQQWNGQGYRLMHVLPSKAGIWHTLVQLVCLMLTITLWCPDPGETLVFERRA